MNARLETSQQARPGIGLAEWLRQHLPSSARRKVRALTDPLAGPLGSIRGVRTEARVVGLSFDDGPDPAYTPKVLDLLLTRQATATWFVLIDRAEAHPELIARMLSEGHDVGLHGVDHQRLTRMTPQELKQHVREGVSRLTALTGRPVCFFRPPYGAQNLLSFRAVRKQGMESVVWSADCDDWSQHPEAVIAARAVRAAAPGALLLLHDGLAGNPLDIASPPALDRALIAALVVEGLESLGLRGVSLSELLKHGEVHRTLWFRP
jgi:peptidoglycan/xylan/chitin deacetylase (PgdA/CDA1 family)